MKETRELFLVSLIMQTKVLDWLLVTKVSLELIGNENYVEALGPEGWRTVLVSLIESGENLKRRDFLKSHRVQASVQTTRSYILIANEISSLTN